jgi:hypothetical protein
MNKLGYSARAAIAGAVALLVMTALSAQDARRPLTVTPKTHAATQKHTTVKPAKSLAKAQMKKPSTFAPAAEAAAEKEHRLILQVNSDDPAAMNLALNNAMNVAQYYKETART